MQLRESKPPSFHRTNFRISSSSTTRRLPGTWISGKTEELVLLNSAVLVSIVLHVSGQFLEMTEIFFLVKYPSSSVYGSAIQNRGQACLRDSEFSRERGTFQSCSLSPDHKILSLQIHRGMCFFLLRKKFICSRQSSSFRLCMKFSTIPQFLGQLS